MGEVLTDRQSSQQRSLERDAESQTNFSPCCDSLLIITGDQLSESGIVGEVGNRKDNRLLPRGSGTYANIEVSYLGKRSAATAIIEVWGEQRAIEDVVDIRAEVNHHALGDGEILVYPKVCTPERRTNQHVPPGDCGIAEKVCAHRWWAERGGVPHCGTAGSLSGLDVVGDDIGPEVREVEVSDSVHRAGAYIAGERGVTVIAKPERSVTGSCLGEHVECFLPSSHQRVHPS